jgi:hypothetical protein
MEKLCQHSCNKRPKSGRPNWWFSHRYNRLALVDSSYSSYSSDFLSSVITSTDSSTRSFLGQCPPTLIALFLVLWYLDIPSLIPITKQSQLFKLRRIDFLGAILLSTSIICGLLVLDLTSRRISWTHPHILSLFGASIATGTLFLLVEGFWAKEPIFPLRLLRERDVLTSYVNLGFQSGAQMAASSLLLPIW